MVAFDRFSSLSWLVARGSIKFMAISIKILQQNIHYAIPKIKNVDIFLVIL